MRPEAKTVRAYRPSYVAMFEVEVSADPEVARKKEQNIEAYAVRARARLPLFEEPDEESIVPVRIKHCA